MGLAGSAAFTAYRVYTDEATGRELEAYRSGQEGATMYRVALSVLGSPQKPLASSKPKVTHRPLRPPKFHAICLRPKEAEAWPFIVRTGSSHRTDP